jgi:PST family polysaccharide transporter
MTIPLTPETGETVPARGVRDLDRSLLHGIAWTSGAKWASQLLGWASTVIVARLLSPQDYGLVGMAAIYLGLITLLSEFGVGQAVIVLRELSDHQVAQLNGMSLLFGVAAFVLSALVAAPLGRFFHAPELPAVVVAMSGAFVITAFKIVPFALLQRDLRFKALAVIEAGRALVLAVSMILFAVLGLRYWTLVLGGLLSAGLSTAATLVLLRRPLAWPHVAALRQAMTFSGHVLVGRLSWYTYSNADFLVAGRLLGQATLGLYGFGWTLANLPIEKITSMVSQVTPAVFSAVQDDLAALRRYLVGITEALAFFTFPASIGMALVAPEFVPLALGDKWLGAVAPLQLLALSTALRSVTPLLSQLMSVIGQTHLVMKYGLVYAVLLPAIFYLSALRWGAVGLALVWVVVYPILMLPVYRRVLGRIQLPARDYLAAIWPALSTSLLMAVAVLAVRRLGGSWPRGMLFGAEVTVGALAYAAACLGLYGPRIRAFRTTLGFLRRRGPAGEVASTP